MFSLLLNSVVWMKNAVVLWLHGYGFVPSLGPTLFYKGLNIATSRFLFMNYFRANTFQLFAQVLEQCCSFNTPLIHYRPHLTILRLLSCRGVLCKKISILDAEKPQ